MEEKIVTAENLTIAFPGNSLIEGASFAVGRGEWLGIYGEPETGKSSLLLALCGVKAFYDGSITVFGYSIDDRRERYKKHIGLVPQQDSLFANMTVGENIDFIAAIHGCKIRKSDYVARRDELIAKLGLEEAVFMKVKTLNRGQKKRVSLACALIHKPDLLLTDDLTSNVDSESALLLRETVIGYHQDGGTCISTVSALRDVELFTHVGIIENKRLAVYSKEEFAGLSNNSGAAGMGR